MAVASVANDAADPLLPWLNSIKQAINNYNADPSRNNTAAYKKLVSDCINTFKDNPNYQNDDRFLKVWFLHMDAVDDFNTVFREMDNSKICATNSMLYQTCALILEVRGQWNDAHRIYRLGISRNAEPIEELKKAYNSFLEKIAGLSKACTDTENITGLIEMRGKKYLNPWSKVAMGSLSRKILPDLVKYHGYHSYSRNYAGKIPLSSLQISYRNKIIKIGVREYQIKGRAGEGGFAQVFRAYVNSDPDDAVALKIQNPAFPWEFHMYRQLDKRIPDEERLEFGSARRMHHYTDYSILVCDYLPNGTLHDAINSYIFNPCDSSMEEVSCIYYTIEMLHMLETLHSSGIIHGDFKPDNLLIRHSREQLTDDTEDFVKRSGPWRDQGLCLIDWGRGIDLSLFPAEIEFVGDCGTSGFRCVEMQEDKPWKYQVDTYGLCVTVHMMLHNTYMEIKKKASPDGGYFHLPTLPFKRSPNTKLWENLFKRLLNVQPSDDHLKMLRELRESFEGVMLADPSLLKKLKDSLRKQRTAVCSG
ncbi:mitotic checkpoint serine/threonine-protein kinase BUB1 [Silene latifolia]|uniref:mitotic checkpoint serine/threonine-protein kinase BUB1 n=1 Tax=Silene latifolia TaxID=37657 RepID=UPI003D7728DB